jgi:hypothetical protein
MNAKSVLSPLRTRTTVSDLGAGVCIPQTSKDIEERLSQWDGTSSQDLQCDFFVGPEELHISSIYSTGLDSFGRRNTNTGNSMQDLLGIAAFCTVRMVFDKAARYVR